MNKHEFKGLGKIFSFTLARQLRAKGFVTTTLIFAIICFLLPAIILPIFESSNAEEQEFASTTTIEEIYVVDHTETTQIDFNLLNQLGNETFQAVTYTALSSVEDAAAKAEENPKALVLALEPSTYGYKATLLSTDATDVEDYEKDAFLNFVKSNMQTIMIYKSGIPYEALAEMTLPVNTVVYQGTDAPVEADPLENVKAGLSAILPYLNLMILYFLLLFYGQNIANIVIMEKTSKLMDTFLVCVKPTAMIFGKVLATITACVLQLLAWIASLLLGFGAGIFITKQTNPGIELVTLTVLDSLSSVAGIFSLEGILLAVLMVILSFALYCSLAAMGGSLASKPDDLNSANSLFTLVILVSFFALFYGDVMNGNIEATLAWYDMIPFTAALITPSKMLLGYLTIPEILASLGIMTLVIFFFLYLAGRLYKLMSLYKGDFPKFNQVIKMLTNK